MSKNARSTTRALRSAMTDQQKPRFLGIDMMGWKVHAGPFKKAPTIGSYNVNLQAEKPYGDAPIHHRLPIVDFGLPPVRATSFTLALIIFRGVLQHKFIYVGCKGGIGRTGMILSLLVRVAYDLPGYKAIEHVREAYTEHAVETEAQENFVRAFPTRNLRRWLKVCKWFAK